MTDHAHLLSHALDLRRAGRPVAGCLLVGARGSTPQGPGALMLVDERANLTGSIGGGCVEAEVRRRAHEMLGRGASGLLSFTLDHDYGWDDGLICGGTIELAVAPMPDAAELERILGDLEARRPTALALRVDGDTGPVAWRLELPPRPRLYVAGAGHIGQAVVRAASGLGFEITMFDDRADMLERFAPPGAATVAGPIGEQLAAHPADDDTCCAIVTRGHRHDAQALAAVVGRGAGYVGMLGSRRKADLIFDELLERGVSRDALAAVRAPIGLDIGAVTIEEIAIAIVAELIQVRAAKPRRAVTGPLPLGSVEAPS